MFSPYPTAFTADFKSRWQAHGVTLCSSSGRSSIALDPLSPHLSFFIPPRFIHHLTQHICELTPTTMAGRKALKHWLKVCSVYYGTVPVYVYVFYVQLCWALGMAMLVCRSIRPDWNISTAFWGIVNKFSEFQLSVLNVPLRMNCNNSSDPLTFGAIISSKCRPKFVPQL